MWYTVLIFDNGVGGYARKELMNNKMNIEGRLKNYLMSGLLLGILAVVVNIYVYTVDIRAGLIMTGFVLLYIAVQLVFFLRGARTVFRDMVNFATQYGQVQSSLLKNLDSGHLLGYTETSDSSG